MLLPTRQDPAVELYRHGRWHGWVQPRPRAQMEWAAQTLAWQSGSPIFLPDAAGKLAPQQTLLDARLLVQEESSPERALQRLCSRQRAALQPEYEFSPTLQPASPDGDFFQIAVHWSELGLGRGAQMRDLWIRATRLSDHPEDGSFGLRVGFGRSGVERDDPAFLRARRAADLAQRFLPELGWIQANEELWAGLERLAGRELLCVHHLAYWIDLEGGCSFQEPRLIHDPLGMTTASVWLQLAGSSLWIALSHQKLVEELLGFSRELELGSSSWLLDQLYPEGSARRAWRRLCASHPEAEQELDRAYGGLWRPLLDRGPEFTARLAQAQHAYALRAGDILVLPRAHAAGICMAEHFGSSEYPAYGVWVDLRPRELPQEAGLFTHL